jgi:hypothetical protein
MSPNRPSDIPYPSSAWAAAPAGTAGLEGGRSTFAAGAEERRIAWAGLDCTGLAGDRSYCYMANVSLRSVDGCVCVEGREERRCYLCCGYCGAWPPW